MARPIRTALIRRTRVRNSRVRRTLAAALAALASAAISSALSGSPAMAPPDGRGFAPVLGTRLFYEVRGEGEAVVLIHGGQLDSRMWDGQFEILAREFRVLRYDVRGYGGSPPATAVFSDAQDLAALLDYLQVERAHLVGLSLGGRIALDFALVAPARTLSLTLAGSGLAGFDAEEPGAAERWVERVVAAQESAEKVTELWLADPFMAPAMEQERLAPRLRRLAFENAHAWLQNGLLQASPRPRAATRLAEITAPTLVILGDRDVPAMGRIAAKLAAEIPGARRLGVAGAGHMVNMERPEEFNGAVLGFLRSLAGRAGAERR